MSSKVYLIPAADDEPNESVSRKARAAYLQLGLQEKLEKDDFVALKIHFGEKNNTGYINPHWLQGLIREIQQKTPRAFLTDSNTLYVGNRSNSIDHLRLAWSHGFTPDIVGIPVIIADGLTGRDVHETKRAPSTPSALSTPGSTHTPSASGAPPTPSASGAPRPPSAPHSPSAPHTPLAPRTSSTARSTAHTPPTPTSLSRIKSAKISGAFLSSDAFLCLTHVTGHVQTGIGAAIKNMGMGCASRAGKLDQHSNVHPRVSAKACRNCSLCFDYCPADAIVQAEGHVEIVDEKCIGCGACLVVCKYSAIKFRWDEDARRLQEKMAEYALTVQQIYKGKIGFINFLTKITKDCDCMSKDQPRIVEDIGILASTDAVAIDKASADLVFAHSKGKDMFRAGYDLDWSYQLKHGEHIGLGSQDYELIKVSD